MLQDFDVESKSQCSSSSAESRISSAEQFPALEGSTPHVQEFVSEMLAVSSCPRDRLQWPHQEARGAYHHLARGAYHHQHHQHHHDQSGGGGGVPPAMPPCHRARAPLPPYLPPEGISPVAQSRAGVIRMVGRRVKDEMLSPEEMDRRRQRRERNKVAAARCRNRRRELTDKLQAETDKLEDERSELQIKIAELRKEKERLQFVLDAHEHACKISPERPASQAKHHGAERGAGGAPLHGGGDRDEERHIAGTSDAGVHLGVESDGFDRAGNSSRAASRSLVRPAPGFRIQAAAAGGCGGGTGGTGTASRARPHGAPKPERAAGRQRPLPMIAISAGDANEAEEPLNTPLVGTTPSLPQAGAGVGAPASVFTYPAAGSGGPAPNAGQAPAGPGEPGCPAGEGDTCASAHRRGSSSSGGEQSSSESLSSPTLLAL